MQNNLYRLVQICFFAILLFALTVATVSGTGTVGVPVFLGALLFLLLIAAVVNSMMQGRSAGRSMQEFQKEITSNKGGVITLAVIVLAVLIAVLKAI